jgi:undecaprenyl-diphosphatase
MEDLNYALFMGLNAPAHPGAGMLAAATFLAEYTILLLPLVAGLGWLRGNDATRTTMLLATASALLGLLANQLIGLVWQHPRPFMVGVGHTLIPHVADSSFPSDHLTLWWAFACGLLAHRPWRAAGAAMLLLGLPVAWARVYLGVHFPLDMLGAAVVAGLAAWLALRTRHGYMPHAYGAASAVHRALLGPLIGRGWVRP